MKPTIEPELACRAGHDTGDDDACGRPACVRRLRIERLRRERPRRLRFIEYMSAFLRAALFMVAMCVLVIFRGR